jgi:hypothetical protein
LGGREVAKGGWEHAALPAAGGDYSSVRRILAAAESKPQKVHFAAVDRGGARHQSLSLGRSLSFSLRHQLAVSCAGGIVLRRKATAGHRPASASQVRRSFWIVSASAQKRLQLRPGETKVVSFTKVKTGGRQM